MKTIKIFALIFAIAIVGQSCRKDSDDISITPPVIQPKVIVTSTVLGTVIDDNGIAVEDALVTFENKSVLTDEYGVFQFKDEALYSNGTYIKVSKDGYFDGSRTFYPSEGSNSIVSLELIPLIEVAEFNNSEGGKVDFENVELDFKANSVMNEDGSTYEGNINVAAKYLDPTLLNTLDQMPGDLTGLSTDQSRVVLTSMAMIAVELFDDQGNKLQVQEGKFVDVKIPVPNSLLNSAPSTIPMWHFDEEIGTWIEDGFATLVNGVYETSLPHFSFWNCDIPNDFIFLKGIVVNRGIPIQGVKVLVTVEDGGSSASTTTGGDGLFCGYVPNGLDLVLEIFDQCGNLIYSQDIPASEIDITLEAINLVLQTNVATLSGSVSLCNGTPSDHTFVNVYQGTLNSILTINDDFTFSGNVFYCEEDTDISVIANDPINALVSSVSTYSVNGSIDVGNLELCEDLISAARIIQYGDVTRAIHFDESDTIQLIYDLDVFTNGSITLETYFVTIVDWLTGDVMDSEFKYKEGQTLQNITETVTEAGFKASGLASVKKVSQGNKDFIIVTGTLNEIEVIDEDLYDESYDELFYYLAFEL